MERLTVEAIEDPHGLRAFIRFPEILYRDDPCWVAPLRRDERARLFLARWDREIVGRVAVIVDRWHLERWKDGAGFFEAIADDPVAGSLFEAALGWLLAQGLAVLRGPFNPSTNDVCGLLTDGFQYPPRIMMPHNPSYYPTLLERVGLRPVRELLSDELDVPPALPEAISRVASAASVRGVWVRSLDPSRLSAEAEAFRGIYNTAWSENWGFVPMSESEAAWMASHLRPVLVPELALFAEWDGRPVGLFLCLPDLNPALCLLRGRVTPLGLLRFLLRRRRADELRVILLGVLPQFRRRGIEALLLQEAFGAMRRLGYRRAELGWIDEENAVTRRAAERWGARVVKRYRMYEAAL